MPRSRPEVGESKVEIARSQDGQRFQPVGEAKSNVSPTAPGPLVHVVRTEVKPQLTRYVRVRAVNVGVIPADQPAAGRNAWLFVDEILVNP